MWDSDTLLSALTVHLLGVPEQSEHSINTLPCLWDSMLTYNPSLKLAAALEDMLKHLQVECNSLLNSLVECLFPLAGRSGYTWSSCMLEISLKICTILSHYWPKSLYFITWFIFFLYKFFVSNLYIQEFYFEHSMSIPISLSENWQVFRIEAGKTIQINKKNLSHPVLSRHT